MSATPTPTVETATEEQFAARTRAGVQRHTAADPAVRPPVDTSPGTPAGALVDVFARFAEVVAERLNRAPDRNFVAFLDLLGLQLLPPQPARVPITFSLAGGAANDAPVPAGTQVAGLPLGAEKDPVVFETTQDLLVTRSVLAHAFTRDPRRDAFGPRERLLAGAGGEAPVFEGEFPARHHLYLSYPELAVQGRKRATLAIVPTAAAPWPRHVLWSTFDGTDWVPLASRWDPERWEVSFDGLAPVGLTTVDGRAEPWIRGSFTLPLRRPPTPQTAYAGATPLPAGEAASAFGAGWEPLLVPAGVVPAGARVQVKVDVADPGNPREVVWEYGTGPDAWGRLDAAAATEDGTAGLRQGGTLSFTAPADWAASPVGHLGTQAWIRARVAPSGYGDQIPSPPMVRGVSVGYELTIPPVDAITVRIEMEGEPKPLPAAFANQAPVDLTKDFYPFGERPRFGDTFYFAVPELADKPGALAALEVSLTTPAPAPAQPSDTASSEVPPPSAAPSAVAGATGTIDPSTPPSSSEAASTSSAGASPVSGGAADASPSPETTPPAEIRNAGEPAETAADTSAASTPASAGPTASAESAPSAEPTGSADAAPSADQTGSAASAEAAGTAETGPASPEPLPAGAAGGADAGAPVQQQPAGGSGLPAAVPQDLVLRWEFWNAPTGRWALLGESGTAPGLGASDHGFVDGTRGLAVQDPADEPARVRFRRPDGMGETEVNGVRGTWLRVRITGGGYGGEAVYTEVPGGEGRPPSYTLRPATYRPPSIRALALSYLHRSEPAPPLSVLTDNDAYRVEHTAAAAVPDVTFVPFAATEGQPALYLGFTRPGGGAFGTGAVTLYLGLREALYGGGGPAPAGSPPAVAWEYWDGSGWSGLDAEDGTRAFTRRGTVTFVAPPGIRLSSEFGEAAYWIRARLAAGGYASPPQLTRALLNTTWAVQHETLHGETLGSSNGERSQVFRTTRTPVLPGAAVEVREPARPSAADLRALEREEGPGAVRDAEEATGSSREVWVRWHQVSDFLASEPRSRHYTLDSATGEVRFGDGVRGMVPPEGRSNVVASSYDVGGGPQGNRPAGNVSQLKSSVPFVDKATNPEPAAGGSAAETMEALRVRGPRTLRHGDRAVALSDYVDLAMAATTEVARAWAVPPASLAAAGSVELLVVPRGDASKPVPGVDLLERVSAFVGARTPPTVSLSVVGPRWMEVSVEVEVAAATPEAARGLPDAITARLDAFLHPLRGGPYQEGWEPGRRPYRSEVFAVVEATPGVDHLRSLRVRMKEDGREVPPPAFGRDRLLVYPGPHAVRVSGAGG
ncbi:MAG: putative baseplate assembly protein [Gemmatimonadetes bacterium]|nr:putative baseplate assembly protein [Gemmatimonadota bacterium]